MGTNNYMSPDEAQIRALIDARVRAVQDKDVTAALAAVDAELLAQRPYRTAHLHQRRTERRHL